MTASVATGNVAQLSWVEVELRAKPTIPVPTNKIPKPAKLAKPSASHVEKQVTQQDQASVITSNVAFLPFIVKLVCLMLDQIIWHTAARPVPSAAPKVKQVKTKLHELPLTPRQTVTVAPPKPKPKLTTGKAPTASSVSNVPKHCISGHPSLVPSIIKQYTFCLQCHVLKKRVKKAYLKCWVKNCQQAFRTFISIKALNVHHCIYHPNVLFSCRICPKKHQILSSVRFHKYEHQIPGYKCTTCNKAFIHQSKLRQHRRAHIQHKMYKCFHGGCDKQYKHPQDLN